MRVRGRDTYTAPWLRRVALIVAGALALGVLVAPSFENEPAIAAEHSLVDAGAADTTSVSDAATTTASLSGFDPGNIISDRVFYDTTTMSAAQINSFIREKSASCASTTSLTCLKDYREATYSFPGDKYCTGYQSSGTENAAQMIFKSAQACGINPEVLLVTLQKEQGLITGRKSTATYQRAMGYGCPDNVGGVCDGNYAGFHVQVYYAARQFNVYEKATNSSGGPYFTAYAPGGNRTVRYHPNASCGSSQVFIRNQATANLYYYTPYQPNAAALRAGYGTGDGCSAYGNRNFYNYFTDWFGSTQAGVNNLVTAGGRVFLLTGDQRYTVPNDLKSEYRQTFGAVVTVPASYLTRFGDGGAASAYLRNAATGDVSLLQGGERHRFTSCAQVSAWGSSCGSETTLAASTYNFVVEGAVVGSYARSSPSSRIFAVAGQTLEPIYNEENARLINGGRVPFAPVMPAAAVASKTVGDMRFAPGRFVQFEGEKRVYLATTDRRLVQLVSWDQATAMGLPRGVDSGVRAAELGAYRISGAIEPLLRCGTRSYLPSEGRLIWLHSDLYADLPTTQLDDATCGLLQRQSTDPVSELFLQVAGTSSVHRVAEGTVRHVTSRAALENINGGSWPTITTVTAALLGRLPADSPIVGAGGVLSNRGNAYFLSGGVLYRIDTADLAQYVRAFGAATAVSAEYLSYFDVAGTASRYLRNTATGEVALLQDGIRHRFVSCAQVAAWGSSCNAETRIAPAAFAALPAGAEVTAFARRTNGNSVFLIDGTALRQVHNRSAAMLLNGGSFPFAAVMPAAGQAQYSSGATVFAPGRFIERVGSTRAYLPTTDGRLLYLPAWGIAAEYGLARGIDSRVEPGPLAGYRENGSLGLFARCGTTTYAAAQGALRPVTEAAAAGFGVSALDQRTCAQLNLSSARPLERVFVQAAGRNEVYLADGGSYHHVASQGALLRLGGGVRPAILPVSAATMAELPKGAAIS